jgi:hypothetical protein
MMRGKSIRRKKKMLDGCEDDCGCERYVSSRPHQAIGPPFSTFVFKNASPIFACATFCFSSHYTTSESVRAVHTLAATLAVVCVWCTVVDASPPWPRP